MTTQKTKIPVEGLVRALIFIGIGLFSLLQAQQAETNQEGLIGPALVPSVVRILLIILGFATGVRAILFNRYTLPDSQGKDLGLQTYLKLAAISLLGFCYIWAFVAFGYLLSTCLLLLAVLFLFGTRNIPKLVLYGVCGSIVYYLVFVKVMKIYDPPGLLINIQSLHFF